MASNNPDLKLTLIWTFKSLIRSHLFVLNLLQSGCGHFISNLSNKSNMSSLVNSSYSPLYVAVISVRVIQYYLRFYSIFRFSRTIVITPPPGPISINIYDPKLNRNITFLQDCWTAHLTMWYMSEHFTFPRISDPEHVFMSWTRLDQLLTFFCYE